MLTEFGDINKLKIKSKSKFKIGEIRICVDVIRWVVNLNLVLNLHLIEI